MKFGLEFLKLITRVRFGHCLTSEGRGALCLSALMVVLAITCFGLGATKSAISCLAIALLGLILFFIIGLGTVINENFRRQAGLDR